MVGQSNTVAPGASAAAAPAGFFQCFAFPQLAGAPAWARAAFKAAAHGRYGDDLTVEQSGFALHGYRALAGVGVLAQDQP